DLLGRLGRLGRFEPESDATLSIATGRAMLAALSPFDVGQPAVVAGERGIAVEGPEGTDRMLARARALNRKPFGRGAPAKGTV
ncbi:UDP-2,3-diacylglucosamine diphosphatase LpxI domain-containing protein, partial [Vibrio parahaemolyticus]|uniref:UDP-2,3-diacylglucosamine diphosphatase LpxI domain-containing protein n=1 Tax=Vibrio parahaemolyticus TaxID=670 RepID=UPI001A8FCB18